jgi:hypothetical protein
MAQKSMDILKEPSRRFLTSQIFKGIISAPQLFSAIDLISILLRYSL